jgi:hypothetical protein
VDPFCSTRSHRGVGGHALTENHEETRWNPRLIWDLEFFPIPVILGDKLFIFILIRSLP